ncbi:MAG: nuclear transport factor 2 family protein [Acidobacteriota bacterium]|nr:nuclear transport factor 2 family protein [Acidobacteriota bacterium]
MIESPVLRRNLLKAGVFGVLLRATSAFAWTDEGLAAATGAHVRSNMTKEEMVRAYYSGWETKQWSTVESLLADDFTFTSPNDDDHINKSDFKERCWPAAVRIETIELECVIMHGDNGFAKYLLTTTDKKSFRNTEYFKFKDDKVHDIEVYFGGKRGYPGQQA